MTKKQFIFIKIIIVVALGAVSGSAVIIGNYMYPIVGMIIAVGLLLIFKRRVKYVMADERDTKIAGIAARMSIVIFSIVMAMAGIAMLALRYTHPDFYLPGMIITYSVCAFLVLNTVLYIIYSRYGD